MRAPEDGRREAHLERWPRAPGRSHRETLGVRGSCQPDDGRLGAGVDERERPRLELITDGSRQIGCCRPVRHALPAATRHLWGNPNPFAVSGLPAEHPIELTLIWVMVLLAIFAPLGVWRYRSMSR